ncbi:MAG: hypothetical protein J6B37_08965 [Clostridia bacterium]|nr:hypothetical protein [Clostridia bacterium]
MDYENYDEERYQAELDLLIAQKEELEARETLLLNLNTLLYIIVAVIVIIAVIIVIVGIKLIGFLS